MKQVVFEITDNRPIADSVYLLSLSGDTSAVAAPGQFVNLRLDGFYLRRPLSVFDCSEGRLRLIYKVVGQGTAALSRTSPGTMLDVLTGLGNGYDLSAAGPAPLLIGGGAGVPPLYWLCRELVRRGAEPFVVLGFNSAGDVFCEREFRELCGGRVTVCTVDGSYGLKGFVTDHLPSGYSYFYTCGPEQMLRAVSRATVTSGELSFEERMGCGFGACMGCSCRTLTGNKRICREGPVLKKEEILW